MLTANEMSCRTTISTKYPNFGVCSLPWTQLRVSLPTVAGKKALKLQRQN